MSNNEEENVLLSYVKQITFLILSVLTIMMVINIIISFFASFGHQYVVDPKAVDDRLKAIEVVAVKGEDTKVSAADDATIKAVDTTEEAAIDGNAIVTATCFACHGTGILESPKIGDKDAWNKRLEANVDIDGLVKSAITGKGAMPPRGGGTGLSDEQLKAAIEFMMQ